MLSPLGVKSAQLVVGQVYFIVTYIDTQLSIPIVRSVAYIGQGLDGERDHSLYFQDAVSFVELGAYPNVRKAKAAKEEKAEIIVTATEPPPNLFAFEGLIDELSRAAKRAESRAEARPTGR